MMQHISKIEVAERLDEVLGAEVGMNGLNTLLYGYEVQELSAYAGYNLRPRKYNSICEDE